jgi:hypothetical protein
VLIEEAARRMTRTRRYAFFCPVPMALSLILATGPARSADGFPPKPLEKAVASKQQERASGATPSGPIGAVVRASATEARALPTYRPPRRGSPRAKVGGAMRGTRALPTPLALAPAHLAQTVSTRPSLFWHIDAVPSSGSVIVFTLMDEEGIDPLAEIALDPPAQPGIQRIRVADHGVTLEPGMEYEWSIALIPDRAHRARDIVSTSYIRRIDEPAELALRHPGVNTFAALGLWYDALESISDSIEADPADPDLRDQRNALLLQAKLDAAVE